MSYLNGGWARWRGLPVTGARFVDLSHLSFEWFFFFGRHLLVRDLHVGICGQCNPAERETIAGEPRYQVSLLRPWGIECAGDEPAQEMGSPKNPRCNTGGGRRIWFDLTSYIKNVTKSRTQKTGKLSTSLRGINWPQLRRAPNSRVWSIEKDNRQTLNWVILTKTFSRNRFRRFRTELRL